MWQWPKLAHRLTARSGAKAQLAEEVIDEQEHIRTPVDMMALRFKTWVAKWQKARDSAQDTCYGNLGRKAYAMANQDLPKIELKDLDEALATMSFIKSLPKDGRQMFVDLLNECEEQNCLALAGLHHIGTFACQGGERRASRISPDHALSHSESHEEALCSRVVRRKSGLLGRCSERNSPLQAALRRFVADELTQHTEKQEACTVLFDVESFHDSNFLVSGGTSWFETGILHPHLFYLGLGLLAYAEVRFLTAGCSGFSEGIVISNGVVAGRAQGNHAARLVLYGILEKSHELHPATTTSQWADDLAQRTQAPPSEVVNRTVEAALRLVRDLLEDRLAVASKSVVIATIPASPSRGFFSCKT